MRAVMAFVTSFTSTKPLAPFVYHGKRLYADLNIPEDPPFQSPLPNIITGFTITASSPSPIPRHTSISAKYFVFPYSLLLVSSDQFMVSLMGPSSLILPSAATELTNNNFLMPASIHAFTTFAVPSILVACMRCFCFGSKDTIAAQWYTSETPLSASSNTRTSKISPSIHSILSANCMAGICLRYSARIFKSLTPLLWVTKFSINEAPSKPLAPVIKIINKI